MARLRGNNVRTVTTEDITSSDQTVFSVDGLPLGFLPTTEDVDYAVFSLDGVEIVHVVAFDTALSEVTVVRGCEGSVATTHASGVSFDHVATAYDIGASIDYPPPYWVCDSPNQYGHGYAEMAYGTTWTSSGPTATIAGDSTAVSYLTPTGAVLQCSGVSASSDFAGATFRSSSISLTKYGHPTVPVDASFEARVRYKATTDAGSEIRFGDDPTGTGTETVLADSASYVWSDWVALAADPEDWGFTVRLYATGPTTAPSLSIAGIQVRSVDIVIDDPAPGAVWSDAESVPWVFSLDPDTGHGQWLGGVARTGWMTADSMLTPIQTTATSWDTNVFPVPSGGYDPSSNDYASWPVQDSDEAGISMCFLRGEYSVGIYGELDTGVAGATVQVVGTVIHDMVSPIEISSSTVTLPSYTAWSATAKAQSNLDVLSCTTLQCGVYANYDTGTDPEFSNYMLEIRRYMHCDPHIRQAPPPVTSGLTLTSPTSGQISYDLGTIDVGTRVRLEVFDSLDRQFVVAAETTSATGTIGTGLPARTHLVVATGLITTSEGYSARRRLTSAACRAATVVVT